MSKLTFSTIVAEATAIQKGGTKLWNTMVEVCMATSQAAFKAGASDEGKSLKEWFKTEEEKVKKEKEINLNTIGAYRSTKSVIVAAARYGVAVMEGDKVRGKTEVEKATADLRQPEAPITSITRSFKTIDGKIDAVDDAMACHAMYSLAKLTLDKVTKRAAAVLKLKGAKLEKALDTSEAKAG